MADLTALTDIQTVLTPGEKLLWAGRPGQGLRYFRDDFQFLVPVVMLIGFGILIAIVPVDADTVWTKRPVICALGVAALWPPFGRLLVDAWLRRKQVYGVTSERLIIKRGSGYDHCWLKYLPQLTLITDSRGNSWIDFSDFMSRALRGPVIKGLMVPAARHVFLYLENAKEVQAIIEKAYDDVQAREKSKPRQHSNPRNRDRK